MGNFPADNYIPFVAEEFLARGISFAREHPLIPGQEVLNRPILLALAVVPFRVAFSPPPRQSGLLPQFPYAGMKYPDTVIFMESPGYREFLDVSIFGKRFLHGRNFWRLFTCCLSCIFLYGRRVPFS